MTKKNNFKIGDIVKRAYGNPEWKYGKITFAFGNNYSIIAYFNGYMHLLVGFSGSDLIKYNGIDRAVERLNDDHKRT